MTRQDAALVELGRRLRAGGYRFTTTTPLSHERVNRRHGAAPTTSYASIFGWNRPFSRDGLSAEMFDLMAAAEILEPAGTLLRSTIRVSSLDGFVFVHSAFPTSASDAVFFGPDTYRFGRAIKALVDRDPGFAPRLVVDIGAGSGAGGVYAASLLASRRPPRLLLTDINERALRAARVNVDINGTTGVDIRQSDVLKDVPEQPDLILCNPPYLRDPGERLYRHGGGNWGFDLSLRVVVEALDRLAPDGRLLLYTGTPVVDGTDLFFKAVRPVLEAAHAPFSYDEIDPDVFGEELDASPYDQADRIAVVVLNARSPDRRTRHHDK